MDDTNQKLIVDVLIKSFEESEPWYMPWDFENISLSLKASEPLQQALTSKNERVRAGAALALGYLRDKSSFELLLNGLTDSNNLVQGCFIEALGEVGDVRVIPTLLAFLQNTDTHTRAVSVSALGKLGEPTITDHLIKVLNEDSEWIVRVNAARALGEIGGERAVSQLIDALSNADYNVYRAVALALQKIGDKREIEPLINTLRFISAGHNTATIIRVIASFGEDATLPLLEIVQNKNFMEELRDAAIIALRLINDRRSLELLTQISINNGESDLIRNRARETVDSLLRHSEKIE